MSIEKSFEGVVGFWKKNQDLITQVFNTGKDAGNTIKTLADQLEQNRQDAKALVPALSTTKFLVTKDGDVQKQQQDILEQIQEQKDKLVEFKDSPELTTGILSKISDLYLELADTFDETIAEFVPFTKDEITDINELLQEAAVDAANRQKWADVLDATVKLTEMALKIAMKVAAA
jgi:hypothetical protein